MSKTKFVWPEKIENINDISQFLLTTRGVDDVEGFLNPKIEDIPTFKELFNSRKAAKKILEYAKKGKKIVIHGDYDADGICATSLLWECLYKEIGLEVDVVPYIPDRADQGYGLTPSSLDDLLKIGTKLVITVDCGVRDKELIKEYMKKGLDFVITDHHLPPDNIEDDLDYILVHQRYPGHEYAKEEVCGAMVAYILCCAIREEVGIKEENSGLDLVALATVTDIMPLLGVNRVVVKYGLEQIRSGSRKGLVALCNSAKVEIGNVDTYHLGFVLGPRINATGRIGSPLEAVRLLVGGKVDEIASQIEDLNYQRQQITKSTLQEARSYVNNESKSIVVLGHNWHEGIVGLVAGKLNEEFHRPVLVATENDAGEIRGSARSISGFNITKALEKCSKYLERYGGHDQAAGFSLVEKNWEGFKIAFENFVENEITEEMLVKEINIDLYLSTEDISLKLVDLISLLEPFGYKNRKPLIGLKDLLVVKKQYMGKLQNHMKLLCKGDGIDYITILFFGFDENTDEIKEKDRIDVVGQVNVNSWQGNTSVQFIASDWMWYNQSDSANK